LGSSSLFSYNLLCFPSLRGALYLTSSLNTLSVLYSKLGTGSFVFLTRIMQQTIATIIKSMPDIQKISMYLGAANATFKSPSTSLADV